MSRHPDPVVRRWLVYSRAHARVKRRVATLISYLEDAPLRHPGLPMQNAETRRLDALLGEADRLRRALR